MKNVEEYIRSYPKSVQDSLVKIRRTILQVAPLAEEKLSYGMPAYKLNGKPLVYFGAFKKHIGFYATPRGHEAFKHELSLYKQGKGSVQFPLDKPIPLNLIARITRFKVDESEFSKA